MDLERLTRLMDRVALRDDAEAFEDLFTQTRGFVFGRFRSWERSWYRNAGDAEDLTAQFYSRIHAKRSTWLAGSPFLPWAWKVIDNLAIDYWRKHSRHWEREVPLDDREPGSQSPEPAAPGLSPLEKLLEFHDETEEDKKRQLAWECLERLRPRYGDALRRHYYEEPKACAAGIRLPAKDEREHKLLYKAKQALRREYEKRWNSQNSVVPLQPKETGEAQNGRS